MTVSSSQKIGGGRAICRNVANRFASRRPPPAPCPSGPGRKTEGVSNPSWRTVFSFDSEGISHGPPLRSIAYAWGAWSYANDTALSRVNVARSTLLRARCRGKHTTCATTRSCRDRSGHPGCPFTAVKYKSGAMQALQHYAEAKHIVWLSIDTAAAGPGGSPRRPARARICANPRNVHGLFCSTSTGKNRRAVWRKPHQLFVIDQQRKRAYQGAMDDQYRRPGRGGVYESATGRTSLKAPLEVLETQPQGCNRVLTLRMSAKAPPPRGRIDTAARPAANNARQAGENEEKGIPLTSLTTLPIRGLLARMLYYYVEGARRPDVSVYCVVRDQAATWEERSIGRSRTAGDWATSSPEPWTP